MVTNPFHLGPPPPPLFAGNRNDCMNYICEKDPRKSPHKVAELLDTQKQMYDDSKEIFHGTIRISGRVCQIYYDGKVYVIQSFYG